MQTDNFGGSKQEIMQRLTDAHRELKARVHELESHISLTTDEQVELMRLKKLKLHAKDQLYTLKRR